MQPRVTAILVARNGARHLPRTLKALRSQTRQPDAVIMVDCGSTDETAELLTGYGPDHFISADADLSFGQAIAAGVRLLETPESSTEMIWLLAQDSAPDPRALGALLAELEIAASVAVAGPKVMEWLAEDYIHEFGESVTPYGTTVTLVDSELDQGQNDGMSDVLAVGDAGMLVRRLVWDQLGGFDPALPSVDDSLDFCIRVRLAGHRVSVVPAARVLSAGDGVAGPNGSSKWKQRRRRLRAERAAQLHRRMVYSPLWALPVHWLSLVPLAFLRAIVQLLRKEPGAIAGEFSAAFGVAFHGLRVLRSRRRFAATRTLGWSAVNSLRVTSAVVRRRNALTREASMMGVRGDRPDIRFFASGGGWTLFTAVAVGIAVLAPLLGAHTLAGGGLLPLSETPQQLWSSVGYGWRDLGPGFIGAADPFAAVLALLGSLTFWNPSFALVLLYFLAIPLAALGAWLAASRLTERGALRAVAAVLWVLAPTFLTALAAGRPGAIVVHLLLPWLFFTGFAAARSWSASASAALVFAAIVAAAPSLAPALLLAWLLVVFLRGRSVMRYIGIPIPALALAAPLILDQGLRGNWLALLADPGVAQPSTPVSTWELLLAFPAGGFGGWMPVAASWGIDDAQTQVIVAALLAPLGLLVVLALFLRGSQGASFALLTALLGFATAVGAGQLFLASSGSQPVAVWAGSALSLYWLGLVGAAVYALRALRRFAVLPAVATVLALLVVSAPLAGAFNLGTASVVDGGDRSQPAFVNAEAVANPRVGTLQLIPQPDGGLRATLVRGAGETLNTQSTLLSTSTEQSAEEQALAVLAGNLASRSGLDASAGLAEFGIRFVLLHPADATPDAAPDATAEAAAVALRTTTALDGNVVLTPVGETNFGRLWQNENLSAADASPAPPEGAGGFLGFASLVLLVAVFGSAVLLSIPTGAGREVVRQANREAIRRVAKENARQRKRDARMKSAKADRKADDVR